MDLWSVFAIVIIFRVRCIFGQSCGTVQVGHSQFIAGGRSTIRGEFPWHVALLHKEVKTNFKYKCGGTLINRNTVLTAAHCVFEDNGFQITPPRLTVHAGRSNIDIWEPGAQEHAVDEIIPHHNFNTSTLANDIAILKLSTLITFTEFIQPACVWDNLVQNFYDINGTIAGWGMNGNYSLQSLLQKASIPIVTNMVCWESNPLAFKSLSDKVYCAGSKDGVNACNGDSGGGMVFEINNVWFLRGIVSLGSKLLNTYLCNPREYTVFTDITKYLPWMAELVSYQKKIGVVNHPNYHLLNAEDCGEDDHDSSVPENQKPLFIQYPWVALLELKVNNKNPVPLCHGTLISSRYVVSPAHCIKMSRKFNLTSIRLGEYNIGENPDCHLNKLNINTCVSKQNIAVESVITHPEYNKPKLSHDIALIRLNRAADLSKENVRPVCLPTIDELRNKKFDNFILTGWSKNVNLIERHMAVLQNSLTCQNEYLAHKVFLDKNNAQICLKNEDSRTKQCTNLLSGAPIQSVERYNNQQRYILYGFMSVGRSRCDLDIPDVYTDIVTYMPWILDNIRP